MGTRDQKRNCEPAPNCTTGVINQLLIVPAPEVLLKFAPIYESAAPACALKTAGFPWNQFAEPAGALALVHVQPVGHGGVPGTTSKDSDIVAFGANGETATGVELEVTTGFRLAFCAKAPLDSAIAVATAIKESTGVRFIKKSSIRLVIAIVTTILKMGARVANDIARSCNYDGEARITSPSYRNPLRGVNDLFTPLLRNFLGDASQ